MWNFLTTIILITDDFAVQLIKELRKKINSIKNGAMPVSAYAWICVV